MDSIPHNITVLVPVTYVWFSTNLRRDQYAQVSFNAKPTQADLVNLIKLLELCKQNVFEDRSDDIHGDGN